MENGPFVDWPIQNGDFLWPCNSLPFGYFYDCPSRNHEEISPDLPSTGVSPQHVQRSVQVFVVSKPNGVLPQVCSAIRANQKATASNRKSSKCDERWSKYIIITLSMTSWNHFTSDEEKVKISNSKFGVKHGSSCSIQIANVRDSQRDPDWIGGFCKRTPNFAWFTVLILNHLKSSFGYPYFKKDSLDHGYWCRHFPKHPADGSNTKVWS